MQEAIPIVNYYKNIDTNTNKFLRFILLFNSIKELKKELKKYDFSKLLEKNDSVLGGKEVIKGTRITPEHLFNHMCIKAKSYDKSLEKEKDIKLFLEELLKDYPSLNEEQYFCAVLYYIKSSSYLSLLRKK